MRSVADFIDALGGSTAVGALLGLPATTVASWKSRGSLPVSYWKPLLDAARQRDLKKWDYAALVAIHSDPTKSRERAGAA